MPLKKGMAREFCVAGTIFFQFLKGLAEKITQWRF